MLSARLRPLDMKRGLEREPGRESGRRSGGLDRTLGRRARQLDRDSQTGN